MRLTFSLLLLASARLAAQEPPAKPERFAPLPLPRIVALPLGGKELAIDGSLADWPELPAIALDDQRQVSGTANHTWRGPNDLSGVAFVAWDRDALYFSCVVKDEWHRALDSSTLLLTEVPPADSIVVTIDPERDTRAAGPDPGRREDREFWLGDEALRQVVQWDRLRGTARLLDASAARLVVLHDKERSVTTYEARIAWTEILPAGASAAPGLAFDMQVVLADFDERTDPMPQTRIGWTFGCGPLVDPGAFGTVLLVDSDPGATLPEFPPAKKSSSTPATSSEPWRDLTERLLRLPPAVHDGAKAAEEAGGLARFALLEEIEAHCADYPRVDFVELHHRIHRRMQREAAGIGGRGLPLWWQHRLQAVSKSAEEQVQNGSVRLFRLPMGGWLVRIPIGGFLVDPAGADLAEWLWGGAQFCVLTTPLDMTKRNDQLLLRLLQSKPPRPVFAHIAFHLPAIAMGEMPLFEPGQTFTPTNGVEVRALGAKKDDGSVPWSCSYVLSVPAGPRLMVVASNLLADEAAVDAVDVMILSPRNPHALRIADRVKPRLVLIDEGFLPQAYPNEPRVALRDLHALQRALGAQPSLLLAPGESWEVKAEKK